MKTLKQLRMDEQELQTITPVLGYAIAQELEDTVSMARQMLAERGTLDDRMTATLNELGIRDLSLHFGF